MSFEQAQPKTLDDWNRHFGGDEGMDPFANDKGKQGFEYEKDVAYFAKVKKASLVRSNRGDEQLRVIVAPLAHEQDDASELGESMEHITLPWQDSDRNMAKDVRERVLRMRVDTLKRLYSAAVPSQFAPYDKTEAQPGTQKKVYLDFDGTPLTNGKYQERTQEVNERLMLVVEKLKHQLSSGGGEVEELAGTYLYIHKKPNHKNPDYPYTNWYAQRPQKLPVHAGEATEETPF